MRYLESLREIYILTSEINVGIVWNDMTFRGINDKVMKKQICMVKVLLVAAYYGQTRVTRLSNRGRPGA